MTEQNGSIDPKFLDELLKDARDPAQFESMFQSLKKALIERALGAELSVHLGYARGDSNGSAVSRTCGTLNSTSPSAVAIRPVRWPFR